MPLGILVTEMDDTPRQCVDFKAVTEDLWQTHLADLKQEAEWKEKLRLDAMDREVFTDQVLPEHRYKVKDDV